MTGQPVTGRAGPDVAPTAPRPGTESAGPSSGRSAGRFVGRSPGRLAWLRLKRDRVGLVSGAALVVFIGLAAAAPLVEKLYGTGPVERFPRLLDRNGNPLGYAGGMSPDHWLGVQPRLGRDIFIQIVYGMRTSLMVAFVAAVLTTVLGVLIGIVAGYLGGKVDGLVTWLLDLTMAFPFFIFCFAFVPIAAAQFYGPRDQESAWFRPALMVIVFVLFNWTYPARIVRGQLLSLREREFVEAARACGAGLGHVLFRQLLPNLWTPILVVFSLNVPALITAEAALSFLGIGVVEPTPDLGRLISDSIPYVRDDPAFTLTGGVTLFLLVLAFNLFGDSMRDALDPTSMR